MSARSAFFARRRTARLTVFLAVLFIPLCIAANLWTYLIGGHIVYLASAIGLIPLLIIMGMGTANRNRPVLEIAEEDVTHGSIFEFKRKRLPSREIKSVVLNDPFSLVLEMRSGEVVKIRSIWHLTPQERQEAYGALRQRVSARPA